MSLFLELGAAPLLPFHPLRWHHGTSDSLSSSPLFLPLLLAGLKVHLMISKEYVSFPKPVSGGGRSVQQSPQKRSFFLNKSIGGVQSLMDASPFSSCPEFFPACEKGRKGKNREVQDLI